MNDRFLIVSRRGSEFCKITTIRIERQKFDHDGSKGRLAAWRKAQNQLTGWQSYDGFDGVNLSIVEEVGFGKFIEARP